MVSWIFIMSFSRRQIGVAFSLAHYHREGKEKKDATPAQDLSVIFFFNFSGGMGFGVFLVADTSGGKISFGLEGERVGLWIFMKFIGYHSHERHVFFRSTWEWCLAHGEVLSCACRSFVSVSRDPQDILPCAVSLLQ